MVKFPYNAKHVEFLLPPEEFTIWQKHIVAIKLLNTLEYSNINFYLQNKNEK